MWLSGKSLCVSMPCHDSNERSDDLESSGEEERDEQYDKSVERFVGDGGGGWFTLRCLGKRAV